MFGVRLNGGGVQTFSWMDLFWGHPDFNEGLSFGVSEDNFLEGPPGRLTLLCDGGGGWGWGVCLEIKPFFPPLLSLSTKTTKISLGEGVYPVLMTCKPFLRFAHVSLSPRMPALPRGWVGSSFEAPRLLDPQNNLHSLPFCKHHHFTGPCS